jgi:uncharacterized protein YoaH (UPF0181 family)
VTTRTELTAIIGAKGVDALIAWRPGRTLRVPKNPAILAPIIGKQRAIPLSRALPQKTLRVALDNRRIDRALAWCLLRCGHSAATVAKKLGFNRKTVERLRASMAQGHSEGVSLRTVAGRLAHVEETRRSASGSSPEQWRR